MNEHSTQPPQDAARRDDQQPQEVVAAPAVAKAPKPKVVTTADQDVEAQMRRMSRRSFLWAGVAAAGGYGGLRWLTSRRTDDGIPWPFRRALQTNEEIARDLFSNARLAPEFPASRAREIRVNGDIGMDEGFDPSQWELGVQGLADADAPMKSVSLKQIKALPKFEMVTELKCIEGWATVVRWGGARLADFIAKYPPATTSGDAPDVKRKPNDLPGYVSLMTPGGGYYVGLEMAAALHPQTLLCYEMNGKPLSLEHGAPLRLAIPVKYGIKNIKRIGMIAYSNQRPADYWAEQGYDWYAGH